MRSYTAAGMGSSLRPRANALRCRACRVQLPEFSTGLSIVPARKNAQRFHGCRLRRNAKNTQNGMHDQFRRDRRFTGHAYFLVPAQYTAISVSKQPLNVYKTDISKTKNNTRIKNRNIPFQRVRFSGWNRGKISFSNLARSFSSRNAFFGK